MNLHLEIRRRVRALTELERARNAVGRCNAPEKYRPILKGIQDAINVVEAELYALRYAARHSEVRAS